MMMFNVFNNWLIGLVLMFSNDFILVVFILVDSYENNMGLCGKFLFFCGGFLKKINILVIVGVMFVGFVVGIGICMGMFFCLCKVFSKKEGYFMGNKWVKSIKDVKVIKVS